jgi:hypothetical protein
VALCPGASNVPHLSGHGGAELHRDGQQGPLHQ